MHDFNIHTISKYRQGDKEAPPFFCLNLEIKNSNSFLKKENNFKIIFYQLWPPYKMKFVCAGYPKTGSKSASAALRMLGYNVADYIEELG